MKLIVSVLLMTVIGVLSNNIRQPKEILQRRQFAGYSNSILHENPNYPDQTAQSTVKVNYKPTQVEQRQQIYNNHYMNQQDYPKSYPNGPPQSQLFNVGYSVTFTNGNRPPKPAPQKFQRTLPLDDGEIITGTRKQNEEVQGPSLNMSPQEYVTTALIGSKKQKISGIKPKPHFISTFPNPKTLLSQANLSPTTQKFYKVIEQAKPQVQNVQDLQQKYSWRNLSPGVEIIRSTEVPTINPKYSRPEHYQFDHAKALGRSQDFDFSNGLDNSNVPQQSNLYYTHVKKPQIVRVPQQVAYATVNQNVPVDSPFLKEPVRVDTRYIDEGVKKQFALYPGNKFGQPQEQVQEGNYLQQTYRTIPVHENTQTASLQGVYQTGQSQSFQDYQPDQSRFQYKVYGKNQAVIGGFLDQQAEPIQRQPRYLSNLNTNLRPPPMGNLAYQRRILVG